MNKKDRFLNACYCKPVDHTPVWLMRQAGRYMKEYQKIKKKYSFQKMCLTPELAVRITLLPVNKLDVDAAILFSDLLIPFLSMGFKLRYLPGKGPLITPALLPDDDGSDIKIPNPEVDYNPVRDAIVLFKKTASSKIPLIGFAGAPYTLASYLIEGKSSNSFIATKTALFRHPEKFSSLLNKLADIIFHYCNMQYQAGVDAIQIFDTWAGALSPFDYRQIVLPVMKKLFDRLHLFKIPIIFFLKGSAGFLKDIKSLKVDVYSIDSFQDIDEARKTLGKNRAVQGNLEPLALLLPEDKLKKRIYEILDQIGSNPGHVFNLGHGVLPFTDEKKARFLVKTVQNA